MSNIQLRNYLENFSNNSLKRKKSISNSASSTIEISGPSSKCHKNILIENGALKIVNNICGLCNKQFDEFIPHLINHNHINKQFLTKEFCSALSLTSKFVSSTTFPLTISSIQSLTFYLKSFKLPLYFEKFYTCHHCHILFDSVNLLFNHLNNCDFRFQEVILISDDDDEDDIKDDSIEIVKDTPVLKNSTPVLRNSTPVLKNSTPVLRNSTPVSKNSSTPVLNSNSVSKSNSSSVKNELLPEKQALLHNNDDIKSSNITLFSKDSTKVSDNKNFQVLNHKSELGSTRNLHTFTSNSATLFNKTKQIELPIKVDENCDDIVLKPSTKQISASSNLTPTKTQLKTDLNNKNGFSPKQALQSRSNKRLLRNLKKPLINYKPPPELDSCDTIILNSLTKKNAWKKKICGSIFRHLKCKFCNRSNFKNEKNLQTHYQNFHKFVSVQTNSELLVSRVMRNNDLKKYYQYRCLSCLKMFENFTNLSQHRCKYYLRDAKQSSADKSNGKSDTLSTKFANNMAKPDEVIDYNSQYEFFKNLGLIRKQNVEPVVEASSSLSKHSVTPNGLNKGTISFNSGTIVLNQINNTKTSNNNFVQVKKAGDSNSRTNNGLSTSTNSRKTISTRAKCNQDDMRISLVPKPVNDSASRLNVVNPIPLATNNMCLNWNAQYPSSLITITPTNMPTLFKFPNNMKPGTATNVRHSQPQSQSATKQSVPITRYRSR